MLPVISSLVVGVDRWRPDAPHLGDLAPIPEEIPVHRRAPDARNLGDLAQIPGEVPQLGVSSLLNVSGGKIGRFSGG